MHGTLRAHALLAGTAAEATEFALGDIIEQLKERLRVAVIFGGSKLNEQGVIYQSQNTRSWKSYEPVAEDIAASLRRSGFRTVEVMPEDMQLSDRLRRSGINMAWLNSGGVQGRNSAAHGSSTLEMLGLPYVGHDPLNATTLDNKHAFKREALCAGFPTAPFTTWDMTRGPFHPELNSRFNLAFPDYAGPFIVKPVSGRASLNVVVVPDVQSLPDAVAEAYRQTGNLVLIEKYLPGREFCISVAGRVTARKGVFWRGNEPFAFGALERMFSKDEKIFTSMDTRPITASRFKDVSPLEADLWTNIHKLARDIFLEFNLTTLIRIDIRADEAGQLHVLEANPKPDLKYPSESVTSLVSAGLAQTGLTYDDLVLSLLGDRLDFLLLHHRDSMRHITELLSSDASSRLADAQLAQQLDDGADLMVRQLDNAAKRMRRAAR